MADTLDNVELEKIQFTPSDFGEDLSNPFGIQDTQTLATQELNNFLFADKEAKVVAKVPEKPATTEPPKPTTEVDEEAKLAKLEQDKQKVLSDFLNDEDDEGDESKNTQANQQISKDGEDQTDTFTTLSKDLLRLGVFTKMNDEESEDNIDIKSGESFLERFKIEQKKGAINILENFLGQFGDEYKDAFDAIFVNGVNPKEYLSAFSKIESMKELDLSTEDNQKRVLREYYRSIKWDDTKIETKLERLKDYGELEDEAKSYHEVLLNKEIEAEQGLVAKKQEEISKKKATETELARSYQKILEEKLKTKEINGMPINEKEAQDLFKYFVNKPYKLDNGELITEYDKEILELNKPENHELKLLIGHIMRKKGDLSSVKKQAISKKSEELFTLSTKNSKNDNSSTRNQSRSFFS